jgi:hypothetical protein
MKNKQEEEAAQRDEEEKKKEEEERKREEEIEAKKREEEAIEVERIKQKKLQEDKAKEVEKIVPSPSQGIGPSTTHGLALLTSPINPDTPLTTFPGGFSSPSSQIVDIDDVVVSLGD